MPRRPKRYEIKRPEVSTLEGSRPGSFPLSRDSTAFNADYYGMTLRYYYDGAATWLNDACCFSGTT